MQKGSIPVLHQISMEEGKNFPLFVFPLLEETGIVKHGFTTRLGGVSKGIFSTLNLSFSRGDERAAVEENYRRLAKALDVSYGSFVFSGQAHTANVTRVGRKDAGDGIVREREGSPADGMITNEPEITLAALFADCVPIYFVDPICRAIGLCHSGWRGTAGRIGKAVLEKMQQEFQTKPADVFCAIGPSICQACYEVSEDVAGIFRMEFLGHEEEILLDCGEGKYQLNLWRANQIVLREAGVPKEQIAVTDTCTCCNPALLFSHRASNGKRGNLAAVLALKQP